MGTEQKPPMEKGNQPKLPKNAYFVFLCEIRTDLHRQLPEGTTNTRPLVYQKAGELWKAMSEERRAHYVQKAEQDKQRFETEKKAWIDSGNQFVWHTSRAKTKRSRSSLTPNQSPAGTAAGSSQKRKRVDNRGPRNRSGNRKKPVNDIPALDMDPVNLSQSMDLPLDFPAIVAVGRGGQRRALLKKPVANNNRSRRRQRPTENDPNRPKKPAGGGYFVYLKDQRPQIIEELGANSKGATDISKVAAAQWKAMTAEEKKPYEEKYRQKQEEYLASMRAYIQTAAPPRGGDPPVATAQDSGPAYAAENDLQKDLQ